MERVRDVKRNRARHPKSRPQTPRLASLADVRGWLEDDDPFFRHVEQIIKERHARQPRRITPLAGLVPFQLSMPKGLRVVETGKGKRSLNDRLAVSPPHIGINKLERH